MNASLLCLVEDSAPPGLRAEHGLSFLVRTPDHTLLFDTGQTSDVLVHNARALGVDLSEVEAVVLSHGHYDHTGGLPALLGPRPLAVYAHPAALRERWAVRGEERRPLGPPWTRATLGERVRWHLAEAPVDDQALVLLDRDALIVVLGCCHAGLINTLDQVQRLWQRPIRAVVGGSHLAPLPRARVEEAAAWLAGLGDTSLILGHCTGDAPLALLRDALGPRVSRLKAGTRVDLHVSS